MTTYYCARADIEAVYGTANVSKWADRNNTGDATEIANRITLACQRAYNYINDYLRGGLYEVPFASVPDTIAHVAVLLAGVWLYEGRGVEDFDPETNAPFHKLTYQRRDALQQLRWIKAGVLQLDLTPQARTVPAVTKFTDPEDQTDWAESEDLEIIDRDV